MSEKQELRIRVANLQAENADLRAKLEAAKDKVLELEEELSATNTLLLSEGVTKKLIKQDRDNLQAQVGVMRGALEGICRQADFTARASGGKRRIATIPTGLNRQCNLEKAIEEADYVLSTTPEQAGERVQYLVTVAEDTLNWLKQNKLGDTGHGRCLADALTKYRGGATNAGM